MSAWRQRAVGTLMALIIAGYGYCAATGEYAWPFSPHPMYPNRQGTTYGTQLLYGVSGAGEFRLSGQVSPMGQATLRSALSKMKAKERDRALATFREIYERRRAKRPDDPRYPELLGLRIYNATWTVQSFAKNRDKPKKRLLESRRLLNPGLEAEFAAQGQSPTPPVPVATRDIVIDLSTEHDATGVHFEADPAAAGGRVAVFPKRGPKTEPRSTVEVNFDAPRGRYYVWLRGTSQGSTKHDSVSLHLDGKPLKPRHAKAFGNWRRRFPRGAYAWSSAAPDYPATRITLEGNGTHQLRLTVREGEVKVDQVWLSRTQKDWPSFAAPVVQGGER